MDIVVQDTRRKDAVGGTDTVGSGKEPACSG